MADRPLNLKSLASIAGVALLTFLALPPCDAAQPVKLTGTLLGSVSDNAGVPQMGATVLLFNRYDRLVQKAVTNLRGDFLFDGLASDSYSVRVTMNAFVPAVKRNILVQPGMQSVLAINLAGLLSSIELVYTSPKSGALMTDEWKWVLRSSMTTRPVLRVLPTIQEQQRTSQIFSDTTGMFRVSSGDGSPYSYGSTDLGTAFALATSVFGSNRVQLSGNLGYALDSALGSTGFRAAYSRSSSEAAGPELKLTMQQVGIPLHGLLGSGQQHNTPALRTLTLTTIDRKHLTRSFEVEYGASLESMTFYDRLNYLSPFARATYDLGTRGKVAAGYSSGAPPMELLVDAQDPDSELRRDIAALSLLPRVSLRDGRARVQRTENLEMGYQLVHGSRTYSVGLFREVVRNGAVTLMGPDDAMTGLDLLPELTSDNYIFNIGGYQRTGYSASVAQAFGDDYSLTLAWGNGGVLRADGRVLDTNAPDELRGMLRRSQQQWITGRASGLVPWSGTRVSTSYQWTDYRAITPAHVYFTQHSVAEPGLNVRLRQPIPPIPGMPGRLEATVEMRNLLAQGYLPIETAAGRRLILTQTPRAVRGGLSFIF